VEAVPKTEVAAELAPRTAVHYVDFWRCSGCGRVYWQGSHHRSLVELFSRAGAGSGGPPGGDPSD
jgi:uncharacterized protein with PIN domain